MHEQLTYEYACDYTLFAEQRECTKRCAFLTPIQPILGNRLKEPRRARH